MDIVALLYISTWAVYCVESISQRIVLRTNGSYHYHPLYHHGIRCRSHTVFTFEVMACTDAYIGLQTFDTSNIQMYEIALDAWGNSKSFIRRCSQCPDQASYYGAILDCKAYRAFWVSFNKGKLTVGRGGSVGENALMTYVDNNPYDINYFAVTTGYGSPGKWILDFTESDLHFVLVPRNASFGPNIQTSGIKVSSRTGCSLRCMTFTWCMSFSFASLAKECKIFDVIPLLLDLTSGRESEIWVISL